MARFEYHEPTSIAEAVETAARFGAEGRFLAGGTDLILQIERGLLRPRHVISLRRTPGLTGLEVSDRVVVGACVTHREIARAGRLTGPFRALAEAAAAIGGPQVRNVATVGGNVVSASPAADLVPPLVALDAWVTLVGVAGERELPLERLISRPGGSGRRPEELLLRVAVPPPPPNSATAFLKAGRRRAMEVSIVSVASRLTLDAAREHCLEARIALGSVADRTIRAHAAERVLAGQPVGPREIARTAELALEACEPLNDARASAQFRRHLVVTMVSRALARCLDRVRGAT